MRFFSLASFFLLILYSCSDSERKIPHPDKPNVVVILVDDAGFADFGFNGSTEFLTPRIDSLASSGIVFTDAHVSALVSAPSRAGIITGCYQHRFGFEFPPVSSTQGLVSSEKTLGALAKRAGYKTACFGKWQLGSKKGSRPMDLGFVYSWVFHSEQRSYFPNSEHDLPSSGKCIRENGVPTTFSTYLTDALADRCVQFIDRYRKKPFFIYWAPNAVSAPLEAKEIDRSLFRGHPRSDLAAMTWALDRAVGSIIDALDKNNLLENTAVFFLSDNGGSRTNDSNNGIFRGGANSVYEGGIRVPFILSYPSHIEGGHRFHRLVSSLDIYATVAEITHANLKRKQPIDGVSLLPYFDGRKSGPPHEKLFWREGPIHAMRHNNYKWIHVEGVGDRLYDLSVDFKEEKNVAEVDLFKLRSMRADYESWGREMQRPLWNQSIQVREKNIQLHKELFQTEQ